jgi:hypothetical protein
LVDSLLNNVQQIGGDEQQEDETTCSYIPVTCDRFDIFNNSLNLLGSLGAKYRLQRLKE